MADREATAERVLEPGTKVEVRDAFEGDWHRGYLVHEVTDEGYRLRRASDGTLLPRVLPHAAVRRERRNTMWWI